MAKRRWRKRAFAANSNERNILRSNPNIKFGAVCRTLWPVKTDDHLAARAKISLRMAQYLIAGKYQPSARAMHAVVGEILG